MLIIADTGPLITLIQLGKLELLHKIYPDFVLPQKVFDELLKFEPMRQYKNETDSLLPYIRQPKQIIVQSADLDEGEISCINLYYEVNADAILIEDRDARNFAESKGIVCFGSIAVFLRAKENGLITAVKPLLLQMRAHRRFLSQELFIQTLKNASEL